MSAKEQAQSKQAVAETKEASVLDLAIKETRTDRAVAEDMLKNLVKWAMEGTVTWDKNVTRSIKMGMEAIDQTISKQLTAIMHAPEFQKLEGSWRGLRYLVFNSRTSSQLKIKVLNLPKKELLKDLESAVEFDQSQTFKKVYTGEFDMPGGEPYGALIGDYEITNHPDDLLLVSKMAQVSAAGFCPFLTAADPLLFDFRSWEELQKPRDLEKIFETVDYAKWKSLRASEDARFVTLTMPRVLARDPYGTATKPIEEFHFEEFEKNRGGTTQPAPHDHFTWMNAAYILGQRMTDVFSETGFCTAIRGAEGGGMVRGLPAYVFTSDDGDRALKCPTEIAITDRREKELSDLGFLPLCHYKDTDYAVFFGAQTAQKPFKYDRPEATANAAISARLPYIMATSRFAHYMKVMVRDWIGSFMEASDCETRLSRWINNYVNANEKSSPAERARYPLREAKIKVEAIPGKPGSYNAKCWLRPWLQLEELNAALMMVASLPKGIGG